MIGALINLLVLVLICGLIWWAFTAIIGVVPLPAPFAQVARVLVIVILPFLAMVAAVKPLE